MDEIQQRIMEDLSGAIAGEVRCDPLTSAMYASDGSLYQIPPLAVVYPRHAEDVQLLAQYAAEQRIPLIPRGSGSGVAGSAIGNGIVVDFSRFMNQVEAIGSNTVRVQPGIVRDQLNEILRKEGRYFPPDPSNSSVSTVGSMLAVDAAGSHSVRVGSTRDHVESIQVVLAGGRMIEAANESLEALKAPLRASSAGGAPETATQPATNGDVKKNLVSRLARLLANHADLIQEKQPPLVRNCSGYYLRGVLSKTHLNLVRLLVGSEGTLGLFTSATLHTAPLPAHRGVVLFLFGDLESAVESVQAIARQQPSACDLLDRRLLTLAREADPRFAQLISPAAEAAIIAEQTGFSAAQVTERLRMLTSCVRDLHNGAVVAAQAETLDDVEFLWSLPSRVVPLLTRLKGQTRPLPFVEDVAIPPEALGDFLVRAQKVFQSHQVITSLYAHAAAGQLHMRPFLPAPTRQDARRLEAIARDLYRAVFAVGGTISGEHGDGLSRTAFIRAQYGPLYTVFEHVKNIFDPHNILNPGKIINDDADLAVANLRPPAVPSPDVVDLQLRWSPQDLAGEAARCNGCGVCRTQSSSMRMCPFFRIDTIEEASPRSKANVLRAYATGALDPGDLASPAMKRLADLCFNCKQCQLECPSSVDIPHLMIEAKAAYVAAHGLSRADWILSRAHSFGDLGSTASLAANWLIGNPAGRWILEKLLGISRLRKLPPFARRSFLRSAGRNALKKPTKPYDGRMVAYFVSDFANYNDPELARAFVAVLKHNGISVHVPPDQTASGMAMISAGDLDAARDVALQNVRALAELAREGYPIVCTEPTSAVALKHEYPLLLDHPDVEVVAERVIEAGAFLEQLQRAGKLRADFSPLNLIAGYHTPCHLRALGAGTPLLRLLTLIPGLQLRMIEKGCSGMAGSFGLTKENFATSIRIGWGLISRMREADLDIGLTECCSCKIQMEQGTETPTLHPMKLLALSYGLMPEIRQKLAPNTRKLVVT